MRQTFDLCVCQPEVGINRQCDTVFIEFEVMDDEMQEGTGKSHTVVMPMPDAMRLLQTLQHVQKRFSLPEVKDDVTMVEVTRTPDGQIG